jgi:hypothetical protein
VKDLRCLHNVVQPSFGQVASDNVPLRDTLISVRDYSLREGVNAEEHYVRFLIQLRDEAERERENGYEILPKALDEYFKEHGKILSDGDLEKAFLDLA